MDEIPEKYLGDTAVLLASGPSLTDEVIEYIKPFHEQGIIRVFGLNDTFKICDFLDVFYACDPRWWDHNLEVLDHPCPEKWTQDKNWGAKHKDLGIRTVSGGGGSGLSIRKHHIHYGSNSGFQLLNLAYHYGIRKFILLGYNMHVPKGMKQHFFGPHPKPLNTTDNYRGFCSQYDRISDEHKKMIVNCTDKTALKSFRQSLLELELPASLLEGSHHGSRTEQEAPRESNQSDLQGPEGDNNRHRPVIDPSRY